MCLFTIYVFFILTVNTSAACLLGARTEQVCSTDRKTYLSSCHLLKSRSKLNYYGPCLNNCRTDEQVCGINGVTYKHECEAWSGKLFLFLLYEYFTRFHFNQIDYSLVDYMGECREIGLLIDTVGHRCKGVSCETPHKHCKTIVPPGACCPLCNGGAIRIIYSKKQIDRALYALKGKHLEMITLKGILRALEQLVQVPHCQLGGFLTIENDLFLMVQSEQGYRNLTQIETCSMEAEKIATLISIQSHQIVTDLALSSLTVARVLQPIVSNNANALEMSYSVICLLILKCLFRMKL